MEWKKGMLSFLRHAWGNTAERTLLLPIQSDLQLNQPLHSGYRAGRDQINREKPDETPSGQLGKSEKGGVKNVARVGKCTKHNDTKQTNDEMVWNALTTMLKAPQQAATHWQKYSKLDWDVTAAFRVTDRSKIQQKFIQCADLVSWMGMVLTA